MALSDDRWVEVSPSQFAHESEGLQIVRAVVPDESPYRAWSNFEFKDGQGRWHEVDLLLLARDGLHLVELKYYAGRITGNDLQWIRSGRAEDSPLKLARRKAQYLASKLQEEYVNWVREVGVRDAPPAKAVVPFIQEAVFLHHPSTSVQFSSGDTKNLYGLDDRTGLAPISSLTQRPPGHRGPVESGKEALLVDLLERVGLVQRREVEAGSWVLDGAAIAEGDGWQDFLATHRVTPQEQRRIRFSIVPPGAPASERQRIRRVAEHEFRATRRLIHDAILRPDDIVDSELGCGLVYPYDSAWERLDLWLAARPEGIGWDTAQAILRQVGVALSYAHTNRLVHRGLAPDKVYVRESRGQLRVQVGDWQTVGAVLEATRTGPIGVTSLARTPGDSTLPDDERWLREGFSAPEGALSRDADRVRLDVFSLGALAFYLIVGQPPALTSAALKDRLRAQQGIDVSVERPEVSSAVRAAIQKATSPAVTSRTPDVDAFLSGLDEQVTPAEEVTDPLDAPIGTLLGNRFTLLRRLGTGSTAVGLLVADAAAENQQRVLKVALDDQAASRLQDEAEVLAKLSSRRLVSLIEGPLRVGGRMALLLSNAGQTTLATELRQRPRLSLDLLERWGTDLLEAVITLDKAGVDHRDIKPANLGVQEDRGNREKHLVLFDFSLTRAPATSTSAGTPPYLDPFFDDVRRNYDSAAERYAAAVVLFEMATGHTPVYGDGLSDPAAISDEASILPGDFDPAVGRDLVRFFTTALARSVSARHDTAADMLREWQRCFTETVTTVSVDGDALAAAATVDTKLADAGLSARALSALEPYAVTTVADLLAIDAARLSSMAGTAVATRREITSRASEWRKRFGTKRGRTGWELVRYATSLPSPHDSADQLLAVARKGRRGTATVPLVTQLLGLSGSVDATASQAELAASLPDVVTRARVSQVLGKLQEAWASNADTLDLLNQLGSEVDTRLDALGGVATWSELSEHLLAAMVPDPASDDRQELRLAEGLLRLVLERQRAVVRGDDESVAYAQRRREGRQLLVANDPILLDLAESLGVKADELVARANLDGGRDAIVAAARATESLTSVLGRADVPEALREPTRLARLAAATSRQAGASGQAELHHLDMSPGRALALTLPAVTPSQRLDPGEVRERVRARFPDLAPLPERPRLDQVVADSGIGLVFDDQHRTYRAVAAGHDTTGLESRHATVLVVDVDPVSAHGATGQRLDDSDRSRSFLALGVPAPYLGKAQDLLVRRYGAQPLDLSAALIAGLRNHGPAWSAVLDADAEVASSRGAKGLRVVVDRAVPDVEATVREAVAAPAGGPLLLTNAALLARYGALGLLAQWTDLATSRGRAVWLLVPQLHAVHGPDIDKKPLPLAAPGQFVLLPPDWIDSQRHTISNVEGAGA